MIALDAAREARKLDLVGSILNELAHQALHLKRPDEALRLVRLAYAAAADPDHNVPELVLVSTAAREAQCHAAAGNLQRCRRALGRAEEHFENSRDDEPTPWLAHKNDAWFNAVRGETLSVLADRIPAAAPAAESLLRDFVARCGPQFARSKTFRLISLSSHYFQQGDGLEEGVRVGYAALDGAGTLNSPRSLTRLHGLDRLSARYAGEPDVAEFREQLHRVLAAAC